jgi:aspartyl-tRNA(Asn)/glutamyl-tRNA(Gln) amidotransferase subunit A
MIAFASSLDQAGPMARSAEDCALLLSAMCGPDDRDSTSARAPDRTSRPDARAARGQRPLMACASGCRRVLRRRLCGRRDGAVAPRWPKFEKLGATLVPIVSLPRTELSIPVYYIIAPAEASSNLSRFDGVRFGHRARSTPTWWTCTRRPAPRASAPRSSAAS